MEGSCVAVLLVTEVLVPVELIPAVETICVVVVSVDEVLVALVDEAVVALADVADVKVLLEGACVVVVLVTEVLAAVELIPAVEPV